MCGWAHGCAVGGRTIGHIVGRRVATAHPGFPALVSARIEGSGAVKLVKYLSAQVRCSVGPADEGGVWSGPVFQKSGFRGSGGDSSPRASEDLGARLCSVEQLGKFSLHIYLGLDGGMWGVPRRNYV